MEYFGLNLLLVLAIIISIVIFLYIINKRQRSNSIIILDEIKKINEYAAYELNYFENLSSLILANNKKYTINYKIETPILLIEYDDCKKDNECL